MNPNIPEEIEAMAALIGQSSAIDAMMIQRPSTLATSTQTLKQGLNEYVQQQRQQTVQPPPQPVQAQYPQVPMPPIEPIPNYTPPRMGMSMYPKVTEPKTNDGQLEFNLEPSKADIIINLLKEISVKLTKQNNMLEKQYANQSKEKRIPDSPIKLRPNP